MNVPKELKYTREHEWIKNEGNSMTIGITDYAQQKLTDIVYIELPEVGQVITQGKTLANIESVKSVSEVFAPLTGTVTEVNDELSDSPEKINKDPYGKGWIAKMNTESIENSESPVSLMSAEEYERYIQSKKTEKKQ